MLKGRNHAAYALLAVLIAVGGLLLLWATPLPAAAADTARIRVIHTSFDAPPMDIYQDGARIIGKLGFTEVSALVELPPGSHTLKLTAAGATEGIAETELNAESGKTYTILVAGRLADISARLIEDDLSPIAAGKSRLRVVHASPDTPAVDIAVQGGDVIFPNLGFTDASAYRTFDAGAANLELRPSGTQTVALAAPPLALESGKVYTLYAVGLSSGAPALSIVRVVDTTQAAGAALVQADTSPAAPATIPRTGLGDQGLTLALLSLIVLAALAMAGGIMLRARAR
jgi:hypothetical protein